MPIYEFMCDECEINTEKLQEIGVENPTCSQCGGVMRYKFSPIAMFKMKGMGGYPSLRKAIQGGSQYYDRGRVKGLGYVTQSSRIKSEQKHKEETL